jgi:hypothetical protein
MTEELKTEVAVTGGSQESVELISAVVFKALEMAGFDNVTVVDDVTGIAIREDLVYKPESVMDMLRDTKPELFSQPILLVQAVIASEDDEEPEFDNPGEGDSFAEEGIFEDQP